MTASNRKSSPPEEPVHFIGIGGVGMSGLAQLSCQRGMQVQGSDLAASQYVQDLRALGIPVAASHAALALGNAKTVVYSSAIPASNPELLAAKERGLKLLHRSEFYAWLMQGQKAITVSGTHGKTTTSAMIAHMLCELGLDPTVAVGGRMHRFNGPAHLGKGSLFVAEADESDGSFSRYQPHLGILTNIDSDHLDHYKTPAAMHAAFTQYLANVDKDGFAIIGWDQAICRELSQICAGNRLSYGTVIGCDVRAISYEPRQGETKFKAVVERDVLECRLPMLGKHNVLNALCCLSVARALELDIKKAAEALASYTGVERRMSLIFDNNHVKVFDDYAHNPGKISACVSAIKESWPQRPLHVVFQPHRFSRLETMYDELMSSFGSADHVYVLPVYAAGETTTHDFSPQTVAMRMARHSQVSATACDSFSDAVNSLKINLSDRPAIVLTVGAGDVWKVANQFRETMA